MLAHYLSTALRNAAKSPGTTLVTIVTLALGLSSFVAALAVVQFWSRADQHFANADRIFVATTKLDFNDGTVGSGTVPLSTYWLAQYLAADFPQLEAVARVNRLAANTAVSDGQDRALRLRAYSADGAFLDIFDLPFVAGDARTALDEPASVVLTAETASRLFPDGDAVGRHIVLLGNVDATVTGVIEPIPEPTHMGDSASAVLRFDVLTSRDLYETVLRNDSGEDINEIAENWFLTSVHTYMLVRAGGRAPTAGELAAFVSRHLPQELAQNRNQPTYTLGTIPVGDVLAKSASAAEIIRRTGLTAPTLLLVIGGIVLLAACLNYANLATARSLTRAREVGIRKAIGASSRQIMLQHLFEAALATAVAFALALVLVWAAAPLLDATAAIDLRAAVTLDAGSVAELLAIYALVTLTAAGYPALVLARAPADAGLRVRAGTAPSRRLATLLVAGQFATASVLLIVMIATYLQNARLENTSAAASSDALVVIENIPSVTGISPRVLRDELTRIPEIRNATMMQVPPWSEPNSISLTRAANTVAGRLSGAWYAVGYDFFSTWGIPLLAGREFAAEYADEARAFGFDAPPEPQPPLMIVDRTYAERLGFSRPEQALHQLVYADEFPFEIIGVAEDRPLSMTTDGWRGTAYLLSPNLPFHLVRIDGANVDAGLAAIDTLFRTRAPSAPVNRRFVVDYFRDGYQRFERVNQVFMLLSGAALLIAVAGLVGMAVHATNRRLREIGVRKTLGATSGGIARLLLLSLSKPIVFGSLLAWPLAYVATHRYLAAFVDPIEPSPLLYAASLALVCGIAWAAIGSLTLRAARKTPADVLRQG